MIVLAFESTARAASVAVCDEQRVLGCYDIDNGLTHSELLLPMAEQLMKTLGLSFSDVELLACTTGPGSFTGVRIGTALVKGLALGKNIPCVGVSTLESLAENLSGIDGVVVPVMDAKRGQFYTAVFVSNDNELTRMTEDMAISARELSERLSEYEGKPIYLVGDGYAPAVRALCELGVLVCNTPKLLLNESAASCAAVALRKYKAGDYTTDTALAPTYLRMPQAERERLEREKQKQENEQNG